MSYKHFLEISFKESNLKIYFFILIVILFFLLTFLNWQVKIGADTPIDYDYGKVCMNYYTSGGEDKGFLDLVVEGRHYPHQKYYGGGFECSYSFIEKIFQPEDTFALRLIYLNLWTIVTFLFIGLIGKEVKGWGVAILSVIIAFLTPWLLGNAMWNTKDIPHATGFAIAIYYMLLFFKTLPVIKLKYCIGIALGIAVAISVRIGGLLIVCYFGLFYGIVVLGKKELRVLFLKNKTRLLKITGIVAVTSVFGILLGLLSYPNFYEVGFRHLYDAFTVANNFPYKIQVLFDGEMISSTEVPWYYVLKSLLLTTPILFLVYFLGALVILPQRCKSYGKLNLFILFFTFLFPLFYISSNGAAVYNGWRHIMFAYVTVPVIIAISVREFYLLYHQSVYRISYCFLFLLLMGELVFWNFKNNPYQYCFYNHLASIDNSRYKNYDTDYQQLSVGTNLEWLLQNIDFSKYSNENPVVIGTNSILLASYYPIKDTSIQKKVKLISVGFRSFSQTDCHYVILSRQFMTPQLLDFFYPPHGSIHQEKIEGVTIGCVIDRKERYDYQGIQKMMENKFSDGVSLLEKSYQDNPKNLWIYFWLGYGYLNTGKFEAAADFLMKYKYFFYNDFECNRLLGIAQCNLKKYQDALKTLQVCYSQNAKNFEINYYIGVVLMQLKKYTNAEQLLLKALELSPNNQAVLASLANLYYLTKQEYKLQRIMTDVRQQ